MNTSEFIIKTIIDKIGHDKNIEKRTLIKALKKALINVIKERHKSEIILDIRYNYQTGLIDLYQLKKIVRKVYNNDIEINMPQINKKYLNNKLLGEFLKYSINISSLGRIAAQHVQQMIMKKIKDAERNIVYHNYSYYKNKLVSGIAKYLENGNIIIDLGKSEGVIFCNNQIPTEYIRIGDKVLAHVTNILKFSSGPQIILSRCNKNFVKKLLEQEIPEIMDNSIKIYNIAREAGFKTKVLVKSDNENLDVIGTCIGIKGLRIKTIIKELKGEKVEIIPYHQNIAILACNAIIPGDGLRIIIKDKKHIVKIIIDDQQLPLTIGTNGNNIKLAMNLINWKIDIQSKTKTIYEKHYINRVFCDIPKINNAQIISLHNNHIKKFHDVIFLNNKHLVSIFGVYQKDLIKLKKKLNYFIFLEKIIKNKKLIDYKKVIFNLFLINDLIRKKKYTLSLEKVNISENIKNNLKKYGYNCLGAYFEDYRCLSFLLKISTKHVIFLQSILEKFIHYLLNDKLIKVI